MDIKEQKGASSPQPKPPALTPEARQRQRRKNWALMIVLASLSVLFYLITIVRMGNHG